MTKRPDTSKLVEADILAALADDDNAGFCLACGDEAYGCEPDAEKYTCESCGAAQVYGAEQCLLMIAT